jgi:hypothetical protein
MTDNKPSWVVLLLGFNDTRINIRLTAYLEHSYKMSFARYDTADNAPFLPGPIFFYHRNQC